MKQVGIMILALVVCIKVTAQNNTAVKLQTAWNVFTKDAQLKYALTGICVMDAETGTVLFEKNSNTGMAPASTQKVITTIASFEAFGPSFQYQTSIGYTGKLTGRKLLGDLVITGTGDPTLASSRYTISNENALLANITNAIKNAGIDTIVGNIIGTDKGFDLNPIPDNWIWGDMGNYYGAGHWAINWNENQYDLFVKPGNKLNEPVQIAGTNSALIDTEEIVNDVKTGKAGTGDASVIYADPFSTTTLFQGTLESTKNKVSGAIPNADLFALNSIKNYLQANKIFIKGEAKNNLDLYQNKIPKPTSVTNLYTQSSPTLDSIVYWFLKKSLNLYGEALVRTIGIEKKGVGSTAMGLEWIDSFYTANGFDTEAIHMYDGSGLSPANRVTPYAMTKALYFAKRRSWFSYFYDALPLYNGMKLKSGTINGVRCFTGYHTASNGKKYVIAILINNYDNSKGSVTPKIFKVLDALK